MSKEGRILVVGHPLVVDVNREVWSKLAKRHGLEVDLVVPRTWKSNLIKELEYTKSDADKYFKEVFPLDVYFPGNGSLYFFNLLSLWQILLKRKYRKIILTQETWSFSLLFLFLIKKLTFNSNTSIYLWVCQNIKKKKLFLLRFFERFICLDVQRIMGCCSETIEVSRWKGLKKEEYYLPFSYEQERFKFQETKEDKINIGYIGRISEEKGIGDILSILDHFDHNKVQFHVAGAGNLEDLIKQETRIEFHGVLNHSEANHFYERMNIIVLPSRTKSFWKEQFGRVIVEGVSSGCDIVGSDSGAIPEVMKILGIKEFNFTEGNQEDFIAKLQRAIDKNNDVGRKKINSKRAADLFSHEAVADLLFLYLEDEESEKGQIVDVGEINEFT